MTTPLTPLGTALVVLGVLLGLWLIGCDSVPQKEWALTDPYVNSDLRYDVLQDTYIIATCTPGFNLTLVHPRNGGSELEVEECVGGMWVVIGTIPIEP